ncbi:MAG: hypothetical protein WC593_01780 [Methanoregula sp.]
MEDLFVICADLNGHIRAEHVDIYIKDIYIYMEICSSRINANDALNWMKIYRGWDQAGLMQARVVDPVTAQQMIGIIAGGLR